MTRKTTDDPRYDVANVLAPATLPKLVGIGGVVVVAAALFAWTGGWFAAGALTQTRMIEAFEAANGPHEGFRRNHAKGVCVAGSFASNGAAAKLSTAQVFKSGQTPVIGRFALAGGMPMMADAPTAVRSLALQFNLTNGEVWRTGMNDIPVFPLRDAQAFYDNLVASRPDPKTGKPNPDLQKAFGAAHPETLKALAAIRAVPFASGFANAPYNGLNAFLLADAAGKATPVRWSMVPVDAFYPLHDTATTEKNYLFDALAQRLAKGPAEWRLVLTVGQPGDPTNDATQMWPEGREKIDAGTLSIVSMTSETEGNCRDINFDPLVLPSGIAASDDPLLQARSAAYSTSFNRREGEPKTPSAVQVTG
ncbi:MAG: catalase family peroxidase, partial [Alphaproteobacteria bacterium]|nr:catalase family peroxidase [Alphaproteobacteria bacterium]